MAVDWCWAFRRWQTSGVQRAAWVGVVLWISRSIKERLIIGVGGGTGVCGADDRVGMRVSELMGLSGWVGVVCCVVVVGSGGVGVVGSRGGFCLSAVMLTLGVVGAWLGVLFDALYVVGGGGKESGWVSGG